MPSNKQAQPLKPLLKTWTGWERGIGHLPESDEDETKGLYFANGVLGIHGELRPAPFFRTSGLNSHILRRVYNDGSQGAIAGLQISPSADNVSPAIITTVSDQGTSTSNAGLFKANTVSKSVITGTTSQTVTHGAGFTPKGFILWTTGQVGATVTGTDIAIVDSNPDTFTSVASAFGSFVAGEEITVSGSSSNDGNYTLTVATASTLTVGVALVAEGASASITITGSAGGTVAAASRNSFGLSDGTTDGANSWFTENAASQTEEITSLNLTSDSKTNSTGVPTISTNSGSNKETAPGFTVHTYSASLSATHLGIISIEQFSYISDTGPSSVVFDGTTCTLIKTLIHTGASRLSLYRIQRATAIVNKNLVVTWADNQVSSSIHLTGFSNTLISGSNGSDAVISTNVKSNTDTSATSLTVNMNSFQNPTTNVTYGTSASLDRSLPPVTTTKGLDNELYDYAMDLVNFRTAHHVQWQIGEDTTVTSSSTQGGLRWWVGIAIEIAAGEATSTTYSTAPVSPTANSLVLVSIDSYLSGGTAAAPTSVVSSGSSQTWTKVTEKSYNEFQRMLSVWQSLDASPASAETIDITFAVAHNSAEWHVTQFTNVGTGAPIVTSNNKEESGTGTSEQTDFPNAFASSSNGSFAVCAKANTNNMTKDSNLSELLETHVNDAAMMSQFKSGEEQVITTTWSGSVTSAQIALEIDIDTEASSASNTARRYGNKAIILVDKDGGSTVPECTISNVGATTFRLDWTNNDAVGDIIHYMCLGGTSVSVEVDEWTLETDLGTQTVSSFLFKPQALLNVSGLLTAAGSSPEAKNVFGSCDGTNEFNQTFQSSDSASTTQSTNNTSITSCLSNTTNSGGVSSLQSFEDTGFVMDHTTAWNAAYKVTTMAITGLSPEIGQFTKITSEAAQTAVTLNNTSGAYILSSALQTTNGEAGANAAFSFGAASATGSTTASCWIDENGVTTTNTDSVALGSVETSGANDIVFEELDVSGNEESIGYPGDVDMNQSGWVTWHGDGADPSHAIKINYIAFKATSDSVTSTSININTTASNSKLVVGIATDKSGTVNSIVFNTNQSLTRRVGDSTTTDTTLYALEIWELVNPVNTTANIVVTMSADKDFILTAWSISGASNVSGISGTFTGDDIDDYFSAGVGFNQPDASSGVQNLIKQDIIVGVSVDDSTTKYTETTSGNTFTSTTAIDDTTTYTQKQWMGYTVISEHSSAKGNGLQVTGETVAKTLTGSGGWSGTGKPDDTTEWKISGTSFGTMETLSTDRYEATMHFISTVITDPWHKWQTHWYFEESIADDDQYLYLVRGRPSDANDTPPNISDPPVLINKINLKNSDFGLDLGAWEFPDLTFPGQVARYKGNWFLPSSGTSNPRKLTVGSGTIEADTLTGITDAGVDTVEHLANGAGTGGFQLVGHRSGEGWRETISEIVSGTTVNPELEAAWASYFGAGDKNERAAGLAAVGGGDVFLNKDGLWSYYPDTGRSSLIFEDFKIWRSLFANIPISPWRGGLIMPHPSGLLFWTPGQLPVNIGFDSKTKSYADPPSNVTNYNQGRYLGAVGVGDYIYCLYQPDITSFEINVLCGYLHTSARKEEIVWQVIGTTFLYNPDYNANIGVSLLGRPKSSSYETPTLWFNNGNNMNFIYLDDRSGPFRAIQQLTRSGFALLPELFFQEREDLSEMIIYTQGMRSGDSWQLSMFADNETEIKLGSPITRNGRNIIKIDRHNVYRIMFKLTWESTSASEAPKIIGADIDVNDNGASVDTITSDSSSFGEFIIGDEIEIIGTVSNDGNYTLISPVSTGTLSIATGSLSSTETNTSRAITVQSRHRESPAIKRMELYGQPTTRGASSG